MTEQTQQIVTIIGAATAALAFLAVVILPMFGYYVPTDTKLYVFSLVTGGAGVLGGLKLGAMHLEAQTTLAVQNALLQKQTEKQ